jgi:hypothetical protein
MVSFSEEVDTRRVRYGEFAKRVATDPNAIGQGTLVSFFNTQNRLYSSLQSVL